MASQVFAVCQSLDINIAKPDTVTCTLRYNTIIASAKKVIRVIVNTVKSVFQHHVNWQGN
jgi:hypothetical protein